MSEIAANELRPTPAQVPGTPASQASASRTAGPAGSAPAPGQGAPLPFDQFVGSLDNKYTGQPAAGNNPDDATAKAAQQVLKDAGIPHPTPAQLREVNSRATAHPQYAALTGQLRQVGADPAQARQLAGNVQQSSKQVADDTGTNVWAVLVKALMDAAKDQQADQQLHLDKLQSLGNMQTKMMAYGNRLQEVHQALDAAVGKGKKANTNAQVPFPDQLSFDNFSTLDRNHNIIATNTVQDNKKLKETDLSSVKGKEPEPQGDGSSKYAFQVSDDKKKGLDKGEKRDAGVNKKDVISAYGTDEADAKKNAVKSWNQQSEGKTGGKDGLVSTQGLQALDSRYSQQLDLLSNKISQEQNQVQNGIQVENQQYGAITSVLKSIKDAGDTPVRNIA